VRRRGIGVCIGDLVELGMNKEEKKDMILDRNPDLGFTSYDSIHRIKINTKNK